MKRYGNLFQKVFDYDNLKLAHQKAKRDKSFYKEVKMVDADEDYYLIQIQNMLMWKTYTVAPNDYKMFKKLDKGKVREIFKLDYFPHRIIQHALMNVIEDILLKSFIGNTFSSIPERGIHLTLKRMSDGIKNDRIGTGHCLKMDVRKFYPSINQEICKQMFRRKFKDNDLLWLVDTIMDSMEGDKGIAIGSLFSQWAGNFYLSYFDHWLKEIKGVKYYYRYCDDLVILHHDKDYLHGLRIEIRDYLVTKLNLGLNDNWQVFPTAIRGIDFVGYRHFIDYVLLRKTTAKNMKRKLRKLLKKCQGGMKLTHGEWCSANSYKGWLKWANCYNLHNVYVKPLIPYCEDYYREVIKKVKVYNKVRATMVTVPNIEVNKDTAYIRSNITQIDAEDFKGWEYDEIQYDKNEHVELLQNELNETREDNAYLWYENMNKDIKIEANEAEVALLWYELMNGGILHDMVQ